MQITIIHLEDGMLISKENYESWRQIQDEYETYKASLGPWIVEEVIEYLGDEYTNLNPSAEIQVRRFLQDTQKTWKLTFNE
jgi:ethanolamine ammonia-lyase large subunit